MFKNLLVVPKEVMLNRSDVNNSYLNKFTPALCRLRALIVQTKEQKLEYETHLPSSVVDSNGTSE